MQLSIWNAITTHPDTIVNVLVFAASVLGVARWRKKSREATATEIDRWTNAAIAGVRMAIQAGLLKNHEAAVADTLRRVATLASAVGIKIGPEHTPRIMAIAHEQLVLYGQQKLEGEFEKLRGPSEEILAMLARIEADRKKRGARTKETK